MAVLTFTLNKAGEKSRVLVSGLFWHPLTAKKEFKREIQALAAQLHMDFSVYRTGEIYQVGFASSEEGATPGLVSVAAIVSKTLESEGVTDFICAAQIPDGNWIYVAQKDGVLLPDGDLGGTEAQIKDRLLHDFSAMQWGAVLAPEAWGVPNTRERDFLSLLPQKGNKVKWHKWWELTPIKVRAGDVAKKLMPMLVVGALSVVGLVAYQQWSVYQAKVVAEEAAVARAAQVAKEAALRVRPWVQQSPPGIFVEVCTRNTRNLAVRPGGWLLRAVDCKQDSVSAVWGKGSDGLRGGFVREVPDAVIADTGDFATLTKTLPLQVGDDDALPLAAPAVSRLSDELTKLGITVSINLDPAVASIDATAYKWTFTSELSPSTLVRALAFPGVRLNHVLFAVANDEVSGEWTYEGYLYAK